MADALYSGIDGYYQTKLKDMFPMPSINMEGLDSFYPSYHGQQLKENFFD